MGLENGFGKSKLRVSREGVVVVDEGQEELEEEGDSLFAEDGGGRWQQWFSSLQDFCIAVNDPKSAVFVNGKFCKDPKLATADDFFFHGLRGLRNTSNSVGSTVTPVDVMQIPGLNTLGISLVRIDYAPNGLIPPHMHPRASEILVVLEVALAGLSSQNPGIITVANAVFGSNPKISADVLAKAFQVDKKIVDYLEAKFWLVVPEGWTGSVVLVWVATLLTLIAQLILSYSTFVNRTLII
ncbi:hypothetical protein TEA_029488 [Camellia sinensis var. sinensis]|uniref:Cupin type-1 domain-containing protein n=1 Tax=Camellia sinensis var. sinensis TaxID=542762 RepID=A0A4S4DLQ4_CAMSN|nr:hypothetical protein TEA_029488 [Camellia sinensis var. sinensis]